MVSIVRKSKYGLIFKSDWKYEFESIKKSLKIRRLKILYGILILVFIFALATVIYIYALSLHEKSLTVFWILYFVALFLLYFILQLKPKTYETSLRGLKIDGSWIHNNRRSYLSLSVSLGNRFAKRF